MEFFGDTKCDEEIIVSSITFKSEKGYSIFSDDISLVRAHNISFFRPCQTNIMKVKKELLAAGAFIEAESEVGLTFSMPRLRFESLFCVELKRCKVPGTTNKLYYYDTDKELVFEPCKDIIEKIVISRPFFVLENARYLGNKINYYHLNVGDDICKVAELNLIRSKRKYVSNIAMIDTGLYNHKYFKENNLDFNVVPAVHFLDHNNDERGHGTGMASILLSILPRCCLTMIKASNLNVSFIIPALQKASKLSVELISCSWGAFGYNPQIYLEIANIVSKGMLLVFSSGNGCNDRKQGIMQTISHPDIISVGGCYIDEQGEKYISNVSSSFNSAIFKNRHIPDICGICGQKPFAQWILMPIQPSSLYDQENSRRDGTESDDGWFVSSGTSAAAAYVSGMIGLMFEIGLIRKKDSIEKKKSIIYNCCMRIYKGSSFMGEGYDKNVSKSGDGNGFLCGRGINRYISLQLHKNNNE